MQSGSTMIATPLSPATENPPPCGDGFLRMKFVANVAADARVNSFFANTDIDKLKGHLRDQICAATGGGCTYTGRDMKTSHTGMGITEEQFDPVVEDLVKALDKFSVPQAEKDELLGALGGMKGDIVGQ